MVNITSKSKSYRIAIAEAILKTSAQSTIDEITEKRVPKGDVFEFSRAAGLLAIKNTSNVIPDCHPLPIEYAAIHSEIRGLEIVVTVEVHTIYKTGVEVEAMHGAAVTALTMYDMLKPIDKQIEIGTIRLVEKKGGKSDVKMVVDRAMIVAVVVCSDSVSSGMKQDRAGKLIADNLMKYQNITTDYQIIPDEKERITNCIQDLTSRGVDMIIFTGGTGLSKRDVTPDTIRPLLDREIPGIMEVARQFGQERTPFSMLSRGLAGMIGNTLVLTFPGSVNGVKEYMESLFPHIFHVFTVLDGQRHD
ncbi:MAG: bifunctional molybdenum cofactor biosynthesis protein MoaC/MoaB [Ignavibacteria bacterium]|nr:bifunctional molybdenum cofactor biosynthesis protein MoaC/MoaB [Ignavibacteria bacterium]